MARMGHTNPRTYGSKLLDPAGTKTKANSAVTTRKFDIEYFAATGKIRYLDEEEKDMPTVDQFANGKKLREEITTLEQFQAIGTYADVAKKYHVGVTSAHGLLKSLRAKKAKEEKELDSLVAKKDIAGPPNVEAEKVADIVVVDKQETPSNDIKGDNGCDCAKDGKGEGSKASMDELSQHTEDGIDTLLGKISTKTGRYICVDCGEGILDAVAVYAQSGLCKECSEALSLDAKEVNQEEAPEEIDKLMDRLDENITLQIGCMWEVIKSDLEIIHKLYMVRAEKEYDAQLSLVMTGRPEPLQEDQ